MQIFYNILDIAAVLALVAVNAFFVAAEFALVRVRASQLKSSKSAKTALSSRCAIYSVEHLDSLLSAVQLGVTLASLALGWVGEPFVARHLKPFLNFCGIVDPTVIATISGTVAFLAITFFHIVFGEQAPKMFAIQFPKKMSLFVSIPLLVFYKIFYPVIWLLNASSNGVLRIFGIKAQTEGGHHISFSELEYMLSSTREKTEDDAQINRMMVRALRLKKTRINEVMLPRDEINALWLDKSADENIKIAQQTGHSRYPVFRGNLDNCAGTIIMREWLWQINLLGKDTPIEPILHDVPVLHPDFTIAETLEIFRQSRNHLAIVVNDENRTLGIVSFEDVLEEIVGDIRDEFDSQQEIFAQTPDSITVAGTLAMHELEAETGWEINWDGNDAATVSQWVKSLCPSRPPRRGEAIFVDDLEVIPLETPAGSLKRVKIKKHFPSEA